METTKFQIVSCSGASNTGKYSDEVARVLMAQKIINYIIEITK